MDGLDWLARYQGRPGQGRRGQDSRQLAVAVELIICTWSSQPSQLVRPSVSRSRSVGPPFEASWSSWWGRDEMTVGMWMAGLEDRWTLALFVHGR